MKHSLKKSTEELFNSLLKRVSGSQLKSFLQEISKEDSFFRESFIIHFIQSASVSSEEKYLLLFKSIARLGQHDPKKIQEEIIRYLNRAEELIAGGDYIDGFYIATSFINEFKLLKNFEKDFISDSLEKAFSLLATVSKSDAAIELKENVFHFLLNDVKKLSFDFNSRHKDIWLETLIDCAVEEYQLQQVLERIIELIGENRSQFGQVIDERKRNNCSRENLSFWNYCVATRTFNTCYNRIPTLNHFA
jgi:hypothetical protein